MSEVKSIIKKLKCFFGFHDMKVDWFKFNNGYVVTRCEFCDKNLTWLVLKRGNRK